MGEWRCFFFKFVFQAAILIEFVHLYVADGASALIPWDCEVIVRCFRCIQWSIRDECGSRALLVRGMCTKTLWMSSTRSKRLQ